MARSSISPQRSGLLSDQQPMATLVPDGPSSVFFLGFFFFVSRTSTERSDRSAGSVIGQPHKQEHKRRERVAWSSFRPHHSADGSVVPLRPKKAGPLAPRQSQKHIYLKTSDKPTGCWAVKIASIHTGISCIFFSSSHFSGQFFFFVVLIWAILEMELGEG